MCQNTSKKVCSIGKIDRDRNINLTYSRKKKARISLETLSTSADSKATAAAATASTATADTANISTEYLRNIQCQNCFQANCDYFLSEEKIEQSDLCDKEMTAQNMDHSNCILGSSNAQTSQKSTHQMQSIRHCNMNQQRTDTQPNKIEGFHSHKADASRNHRTGKNMNSISKFHNLKTQ